MCPSPTLNRSPDPLLTPFLSSTSLCLCLSFFFSRSHRSLPLLPPRPVPSRPSVSSWSLMCPSSAPRAAPLSAPLCPRARCVWPPQTCSSSCPPSATSTTTSRATARSLLLNLPSTQTPSRLSDSSYRPAIWYGDSCFSILLHYVFTFIVTLRFHIYSYTTHSH